jgi:radical SAM protein with 4Fe4S-binding SPASM domain
LINTIENLLNATSLPNDLLPLLRDRYSPPEHYREFLDTIDVKNSPAFKVPLLAYIGLPKWNRIRKDSTQVIYYGNNLFDVWMHRLLPQQVVVLSLFNGKRTLSEVVEIVSVLSDCGTLAAEIKVRHFLHTLDFDLKPTFIVIPAKNSSNLLTFDAVDYLIPETKLSVRLDAPTSLILMLTSDCFTDCEYCYACRKPVIHSELLKTERALELIEESAQIGIININLDGGDVFARPDSMKILKHIISLGIEPGISTKAYFSHQKAKELVALGVTWLQVGLDAPGKMCDKLVKRHGYFDRMIETIYNLTDAGIRVRTNSIITRESLHLLPELIDLLMTLPLFDIKVAPAFLGLFRNNESMLLTQLQKKWMRKIMEDKVKQYPDHKINWECEEDVLDASEEEIKGWFHVRPYCSSGRTQIVITPNGKVTTCEQSPQKGEFICGDCSYQSIMDVWNSETLKKWYAPPKESFEGTACYECENFNNCIHGMGHCWLQVLKMQGRLYAPHPYCIKSERPKQHWR